jgi:uncharacterized OB-fold protein
VAPKNVGSTKNVKGEKNMKLGFGQTQIQTRSKKSRNKKAQHKKCKACGSKSLVVAGPDQFCMDCDWSTCFEYVAKGYMNNLMYAYSEHFPKRKPAALKIVDLPKGNAPIIPDTTTTVPTIDTDKQKSA